MKSPFLCLLDLVRLRNLFKVRRQVLVGRDGEQSTESSVDGERIEDRIGRSAKGDGGRIGKSNDG